MARCALWKYSRTCLAKSSGSGIRPNPTSPQACEPASGKMTWTPSSTKVFKLRCVALAAHICWFMAGATQTGALVAKYKVLSKSSAKPQANLAKVSQLAGATNTKSAQRANSICPIPASASVSNNSV